MYTLAIEDVVEVPVKFTLKSGRVERTFAFTLQANRLTQDEINTRLEDKDRRIKDFMADVITGWKDQKLVLDGAGQPAEFSPEAFESMQSAAGVSLALFNAYFKACGAKEKN